MNPDTIREFDRNQYTPESRQGIELKRQEVLDRLEQVTIKYNELRALLLHANGTEKERESSEECYREIQKLKSDVAVFDQQLEQLTHSPRNEGGKKEFM